LLNRVPLNHLSILNDDPEFEGHELKNLCPLETIRLMPRNIPMKNVLPLLEKSIHLLQEIELDCDYYEEEEIELVLAVLNRETVRKINFHYCEKFNNHNLT
jgi:hypothetical protein